MTRTLRGGGLSGWCGRRGRNKREVQLNLREDWENEREKPTEWALGQIYKVL
ncbi:melanoma inhibitory activity protein 2 isoform X1 [Sesbania bispinosa]|nr:melanoma inhibitory activity protein 2 isoform X1 [Sesbania bispinosa]